MSIAPSNWKITHDCSVWYGIGCDLAFGVWCLYKCVQEDQEDDDPIQMALSVYVLMGDGCKTLHSRLVFGGRGQSANNLIMIL